MTKGGSEPLVLRWFAGQGQAPAVRHEASQVTSILAFVRAGLGVSMMAELAVPDDREGVRTVALVPRAPRSVAMTRRRTDPEVTGCSGVLGDGRRCRLLGHRVC